MKFGHYLCLFLSLISCREEDEKPDIKPTPLPVVTAISDYSDIKSVFDKGKVLNVARGGHGINTDLTWMPGFYDKLSEIGIKEFRIDWLLSDWFYQVVSKNSKNEFVYDFSKLDKIILPLVDKGIKPVMCMCYMASVLGNNEGPPNNYDDYKTVVKAFVQHYKELGHTGWAWESHNEPEGFTKLTAQQTYQMYKYFAIGVKEVDQTAKVGGYGSVGHDWINYVYSFLNYYKGDGTKPPLDFFSFHQYGKPSWEYVPEIEKAFTDNGLPVPDLYLTEWNNSYGKEIGEGNLGVTGGGYDTNVNASYVAKKFYNSMAFTNLKKIYFWNFADADPGKKFGGDMGLFTVDRHRKAAANTFLFYNNLYESVVSSYYFGYGTENKDLYGIVTVNHALNKIALIMWNNQNSTYLLKSTINKLPVLAGGKEYLVKKMQIDAKNGNYYFDFVSGYNGIADGPNENARVTKTFKFGGNTFEHADTMSAYSVVQLLIEPE